MNWKKSGAIFVLLLLVSMFTVSCADQNLDFGSAWEWVIDIARLDAFGSGDNSMVGFMRILIVILVFALFFEAAQLLLDRNIAGVVAGVLALISGIFIPATVLAGIGAAYGTLVALVLIGIPVVGGLYAFFRIPHNNRGWIVIGFVILVILLWILLAVRSHALQITGLP